MNRKKAFITVLLNGAIFVVIWTLGMYIHQHRVDYSGIVGGSFSFIITYMGLLRKIKKRHNRDRL